MNRLRVLALAWMMGGALLLATSGCFNPFRPLVSDEPAFVLPPPVPNTAQNIVRLFKWCWENRDDIKYREVFTADYEFEFAAGDSAGIPFRDNPWRREDELNAAHNLFVAGTAGEPPASSITLTLTPEDLPVYDDLRPGKTEPWHRRVQVYVNLTVTRPDGSYNVVGDAIFYVVRGDSADIPKDLGSGFGPDPNRWYIERWVDLTGGSTGAYRLRPSGAATLAPTIRAAAAPAIASTPQRSVGGASLAGARQLVTWGQLKTHYATLRQ